MTEKDVLQVQVAQRLHTISLQGPLVINSDMSKNRFSLELISVTSEDMAVYYCARHSQGVSV